MNDELFTPLLTYVALFNTLGNYERQFGDATFIVKGKATFDKHADLAYEDIFTGENTITSASAYVAGPITMLLGNDVEPVTLKSRRSLADDVRGIAVRARSSASGSTRCARAPAAPCR